jgi:cytochrome c-type biogenesis protein
MSFELTGIFVAGLLTYMTPCVLPLIPVYLAALAGGNLGDLGTAQRSYLVFRAFFFALGFVLVFTLLGLGASSLGHLLASHQHTIQTVGGVLILLFGLKFLGLIQIPALDRVLRGGDQRWAQRSSGLSALVMGVVFAAGWSPCVGPVLGSVLTYTASTTSDLWSGAGYLAVYGAGFALPLLITASFAGAAARLIRRLGPWMPRIERAMGAALVVVAGSMFVPLDGNSPAVEVATSEPTGVPTMLELYSADCSICQEMKPVIANLESACEGREVAIVARDVSLSENQHLIAEHRLVGVPTFVFLDTESNEVARLVGRQTQMALEQALSALTGEACPGVGSVPSPSVPCTGDVTDSSEEGSCHSTNTNANPAARRSKTCAATTSATSRPSVPRVANVPTACSPDLL